MGKKTTSSCSNIEGNAISERCINATQSGKKRDKVLEKLVQQGWDTFDVSFKPLHCMFLTLFEKEH